MDPNYSQFITQDEGLVLTYVILMMGRNRLSLRPVQHHFKGHLPLAVADLSGLISPHLGPGTAGPVLALITPP